MTPVSDPIDMSLLSDWQRDLPVVARPFARIGADLGLSEIEVLERLTRMQESGRISRVGGTCAPNTVSASTLAAVQAPTERIEEVAAIIGAEAGVNHSYLREHEVNLWFVATGPNRAHVDASLRRIGQKSRLDVLDLRLVRPFKFDLGFPLSGGPGAMPYRPVRPADVSAIRPGDRQILQALAEGMALVPRPYADIAANLGRREEDVLSRIPILIEAGVIARLGVIVRHRALGWRSNAMVVWDLSSEQIDRAGPQLAAHPGVTLCYERSPVPDVWPWRLYSMIHARSRREALEVLSAAARLPELRDVPHRALFSVRCFKQTGALIALGGKGSAA